MKNPVLSLLFSPKGKISGKEFLAGLIIVYFGVAFQFQAYFVGFLQTNIFARTEPEAVIMFNFIFTYLRAFSFSFYPVDLLLSWTVIVLGIKRASAHGYSRGWGIALGIMLSFLYRSMLSLTGLLQTAINMNYPAHNTAAPLSRVMIIMTAAAFLTGLASCLILGRRAEKARGPLSISARDNAGRLTPFGFIINLGALILASWIFSAVMFVVLLVQTHLFRHMEPLVFSEGGIKIAAYIFSAVILIIYLRLLYLRMKNSRYPVWPLYTALVLSALLSAGAFLYAILVKGWLSTVLLPLGLNIAQFLGVSVLVIALIVPEKQEMLSDAG